MNVVVSAAFGRKKLRSVKPCAFACAASSGSRLPELMNSTARNEAPVMMLATMNSAVKLTSLPMKIPSIGPTPVPIEVDSM